MTPFRSFFITSFFVATATASFAGGHGGNPAVKARKAHMQLYAHNLGILGGMAKGEVEYDAGSAQAAANNLAALASFDQRSYWTPGTSMDELGDETEALANIWQEGSKAIEISKNLADATKALAAVAGDGQAAIGPALGPIGGSCGGCHKAHRKP